MALRRRVVAGGSILAALALGLTGSGHGQSVEVLAGYGSSGGTGPQAPRSGGAAAPGAGLRITSSFTISGSVSGLYPGAARPLVLTVANPQKLAISVTSITTTAGNASSTCSAANVKVSAFTGTLHVAAGGAAKVTVQVTMAHGAPNACQGAKFPLHYSGVATEA